MRRVWKVALGLVIALMLPVAAYAAGTLTAPNDDPALRKKFGAATIATVRGMGYRFTG